MICLLLPGLHVDDFARSKMEISANELDEERSMAYELVNT
jgi:malate dehydrogenase